MSDPTGSSVNEGLGTPSWICDATTCTGEYTDGFDTTQQWHHANDLMGFGYLADGKDETHSSQEWHPEDNAVGSESLNDTQDVCDPHAQIFSMNEVFGVTQQMTTAHLADEWGCLGSGVRPDATFYAQDSDENTFPAQDSDENTFLAQDSDENTFPAQASDENTFFTPASIAQDSNENTFFTPASSMIKFQAQASDENTFFTPASSMIEFRTITNQEYPASTSNRLWGSTACGEEASEDSGKLLSTEELDALASEMLDQGCTRTLQLLSPSTPKAKKVYHYKNKPRSPYQRLNPKNIKNLSFTTLVHAVFMVFDRWNSPELDKTKNVKNYENTIGAIAQLIVDKFSPVTPTDLDDLVRPESSEGGHHLQDQMVYCDVGAEIQMRILNSDAGMNHMQFTQGGPSAKIIDNLIMGVWGQSLPPTSNPAIAYSQIVCIVSTFFLLDQYTHENQMMKEKTHEAFYRVMKVSMGAFAIAYNDLSCKCQKLPAIPPQRSRRLEL
mgnify:CR=1 FL=1